MNNYNRMYEYNISDSSIYYQPTQQKTYTEKPSKTDDYSITFVDFTATVVTIIVVIYAAYYHIPKIIKAIKETHHKQQERNKKNTNFCAHASSNFTNIMKSVENKKFPQNSY